jgi:hypothetical protein
MTFVIGLSLFGDQTRVSAAEPKEPKPTLLINFKANATDAIGTMAGMVMTNLALPISDTKVLETLTEEHTDKIFLRNLLEAEKKITLQKLGLEKGGR